MKAWLLLMMTAIQLIADTHSLQHSHRRQENVVKPRAGIGDNDVQQLFFRTAGMIPSPQKNATVFQKLAWHLYRPCASCKQFVRVGERHDGGYVMCGELLNGTRAAYSYGISGSDAWGAELSSQLGIVIQQYDCFDFRKPACPVNFNCHFAFHTECISHWHHTEDKSVFGTKEDKLFGTLEEHMAKNGHSGPQTSPDLMMKMDIEGEEWPLFADLNIKPLLSRFSQVVVEFHWTQLVNQFHVLALQNLLDVFVIVHLHANNWLPSTEREGYSVPMTLEVTFVRKGLVAEGECVANPAVTDLDHLNNPLGEPPPLIRLP